MTTKLPTEKRTLRMDPELAEQVGKLLSPYSGAELEAAQEAVREVHQSNAVGSFGEILDKYRDAITEAVEDE